MKQTENILKAISGKIGLQIAMVRNGLSEVKTALSNLGNDTAHFDEAWQDFVVATMLLQQLTMLQAIARDGDLAATERFLRFTCGHIEQSTSPLALRPEYTANDADIDSRNLVYNIFKEYINLIAA